MKCGWRNVLCTESTVQVGIGNGEDDSNSTGLTLTVGRSGPRWTLQDSADAVGRLRREGHSRSCRLCYGQRTIRQKPVRQADSMREQCIVIAVLLAVMKHCNAWVRIGRGIAPEKARARLYRLILDVCQALAEPNRARLVGEWAG